MVVRTLLCSLGALLIFVFKIFLLCIINDFYYI